MRTFFGIFLTCFSQVCLASVVTYDVLPLKSIETAYFCDRQSRFIGIGTLPQTDANIVFGFQLLSKDFYQQSLPQGIQALGKPSSFDKELIFGTFLDGNKKLSRYRWNLRHTQNAFQILPMPKDISFVEGADNLPTLSADGQWMAGLVDLQSANNLIVMNLKTKLKFRPDFGAGAGAVVQSAISNDGSRVTGLFFLNDRIAFFTYDVGGAVTSTEALGLWLNPKMSISEDGAFGVGLGYVDQTQPKIEFLVVYDAKMHEAKRQQISTDLNFQPHAISANGHLISGISLPSNATSPYPLCFAPHMDLFCRKNFSVDGITNFFGQQLITHSRNLKAQNTLIYLLEIKAQ